MNVAFYTLGCKLNYAETSQLRRSFERAGFGVVAFGEVADVIIINTCSVTDNADKECRQIIRRALRAAPKAFVGVTGCYAQLRPEEIASIEGVDAVFGAKEKFRIPALVGEFTKNDAPRLYVSELDELEFAEAQSADSDSRTRAFLKLQDGCDYKCSFCTIPLARGNSRSMAFELIPEKIERLVADGYSEIVLSGINLGEYRAPSGETFTDAARLIADLKPAARFRISSVEPNLVTPDLIAIVAESEVWCKSFHLPLQSGSPEILRRMRRRYTAEQYRTLAERVKEAMPDCALGADVIVGFPGETDAHFEETFELLRDLPVSYLHVFSYSERDGTPAAAYSAAGGAVPPSARAERSRRLRTLSAKKKFAFYQSQCGSERTVIPETYDATTGLWSGWTENYVRAAFAASPVLPQKPTRVRLAETDGETALCLLSENRRDDARKADALRRPAYIPLELA